MVVPSTLTRAATSVALVAIAVYAVSTQPASVTVRERGCASEDRPPCSAATASALHLDESHRRGGGWSLARSLTGEQRWATAYLRSDDGFLSLRIEGAVDSGAPQILSLLREVDLLPSWNRFCDEASLLRLLSPTELWAAAGVRLPWPVPPQHLFIRAAVSDDPQSEDGVVAIAQSTGASLRPPDGLRLPASLRRRLELPVGLAAGRLRPLPPLARVGGGAGDGAGGEGLAPHQTRLDVLLTFNLSRMPFATGPAAAPPRWVLSMVVWIVVRPHARDHTRAPTEQQ